MIKGVTHGSLLSVIPGLGPGIHVFDLRRFSRRGWPGLIPGTSPGTAMMRRAAVLSGSSSGSSKGKCNSIASDVHCWFNVFTSTGRKISAHRGPACGMLPVLSDWIEERLVRIVLRVAEGVCLVWWLFAAGTTAVVTIHLPYLTLKAEAIGCYRSMDWVEYVECGPHGLQRLLGTVLTLALFWTRDVDVLFSLLIIPMGIVWLVSLFLAMSGLFRIFMQLKTHISTRQHHS